MYFSKGGSQVLGASYSGLLVRCKPRMLKHCRLLQEAFSLPRDHGGLGVHGVRTMSPDVGITSKSLRCQDCVWKESSSKYSTNCIAGTKEVVQAGQVNYARV